MSKAPKEAEAVTIEARRAEAEGAAADAGFSGGARRRYVVINSGFTFREYDYLNNARQTPKLPDYAVVDIRVPPSSRWPGRIVSAGFFGERWELSSAAGRAR